MQYMPYTVEILNCPEKIELPVLLEGFERYLLTVKDLAVKTTSNNVSMVRRILMFDSPIPYSLDYCLSYLSKLKEEGKTPNTRATAVYSMKLLNDYFDELCEEFRPFNDKLPRIRITETIINILEPSDIEKILECPYPSTRTEFFTTLISFLAKTGRRSIEAHNLKVKDINLSEYTFLISSPKNKKPRWLPLPKDLAVEIKKLMQGKNTNDYIFSKKNDNSRPIAHSAIGLAVRQRARLVGIGRTISPHVLRHSFPVALLRAGVPLPLVSELLGHENYKSTQRYTHLVVEDLRNAQNMHPLNKKTTAPKEVAEVIKKEVERYASGIDDINYEITLKEDNLAINLSWRSH